MLFIVLTCQYQAYVAWELSVLTFSWLFHTWALCVNIYSGEIIYHSSVGCVIQSLVIPRASHTDLPAWWDIILCALTMGPHLWLHRGCVSLVFPLLLKCLHSAMCNSHPVDLLLLSGWSFCFTWCYLYALHLACCLPYLLM